MKGALVGKSKLRWWRRLYGQPSILQTNTKKETRYKEAERALKQALAKNEQVQMRADLTSQVRDKDKEERLRLEEE